MKKFLFTTTILLLFFLSGCNDFLDTVPDNRTEIDGMDKVWKLLSNAYPKKTYTAMLEARCDGMTSFGSTFRGGQQDESFDFLRGGFYWMPQTPSDCDDSHKRFWEASYEAISYCNFALEAMGKFGNQFDPQEVKLARAEAKIARAYNHFMLLTMFTNLFDKSHLDEHPGIPYVEETESEVFKKYQRGTIAETLRKIERDLFDEINTVGTSATYKQPKFHFTRDAACAFAVRYCLFTGDYSRAIMYADRIFPMATTYTAATTTNAIDESPKVYVAETDNAYQYAKNVLFDMVAYRATGVDLYAPGIMFSNPKNPSYLLMVEVETLAMRGYLGTLLTTYAYDAVTLTSLGSATNVTGAKWTLPLLQFTGDPTAFFVKYYEDMLLVNEAAGIGYVYNKINLFRLEEVLLARAEAKAMLGNIQEAIDDLNLYAQRKVAAYNYASHRLDKDKIHKFYENSVGDNESFVNNKYNQNVFSDDVEGILKKELILTVLDFRRTEFLLEGMRYLDILRWNIPVTHTRLTDGMSHTLYPDDDNRILQLPETTSLSGLQPNPMEHITDPWPNVIYK
ncbi:MAG: hypothetical protein EZS26_000695 [Candidatus Ordinivivax streblomastigis]|uniref:RagB/SusD family nutrient uptake outer membrane protein n=1 Tax=Candidatus Ordinivivax streblomastigis TaxID=2540710 RepID=A0A5M8P436_9BACT|nr:MAG: hypothetical protein EZS26_000695 [Candidatus Ordinivivax streblomastigis]